MKNFITYIVLLTFALVLTGWIVFSFFLPKYYLSILPFTVLFFAVVTVVVHIWQLKSAKKSLAKFARTNMVATFVKLLLYALFATIYIARFPQNALTFVVCLAIIYLSFAIFEVVTLSRFSKKNK
ncbi:MAG: hypothetical protein CSA36_00590 [Draconibacterium sp.]|nr:MAG: hypothetical protein CSA36_00590 [Draconibacterium sp.]